MRLEDGVWTVDNEDGLCGRLRSCCCAGRELVRLSAAEPGEAGRAAPAILSGP